MTAPHECRPPENTPDETVYRVLITKEDRGWKGTWYRIGQQYDVVPNKTPFQLGWHTIHAEDPWGSIAADDCVVIGRHSIAEPPHE